MKTKIKADCCFNQTGSGTAQAAGTVPAGTGQGDRRVSDRDIRAMLGDQEMLNRWQNLGELPPEDKDHIIYVVDGLIRETKTRKAYTS